MARVSKRSLSRSAIAAYACICLALLLLLGLTMWNSYRDIQFIRTTVLELEMDRVRSHAQRTVGRIEQDLELHNATALDELQQDDWLRRHWDQIIPQEGRKAYAAVIGIDGRILLHSDPSRNGRQLPHNWYNRILFEVADDVVETSCPELTQGNLAYDVRVPINLDGREVGIYHAGIDSDWLQEGIETTQASFVRRRSLLTGGVLLIVLLATTSLYYIASHSITLRRAVDTAMIENATAVGKLAAGLAHEIRNPLHAIQINLHSFRRVHERKAELADEEILRMLDQSSQEIARIEHLMQQLTGFATPDEPRDEVIDVTSEIGDVVDFIGQELLDSDIQLRTQIPDRPVWVRMDHGRLRQIMLNLLQNAQQAMKQGGQIQVSLSSRRGRVSLIIADNGPGIGAEHRKQVFEPFYSTRKDGVGLGLALVKRFVDEVDGEIHCVENPPSGVKFRIVLPEATVPRG